VLALDTGLSFVHLLMSSGWLSFFIEHVGELCVKIDKKRSEYTCRIPWLG
jgi:hypothetical protein